MVNKTIDELLDERFQKLEAKFQTKFDDLDKLLQDGLKQQLPELVSSVFGNSPEATGFANGISGVLQNLANGNRDARSLANAAASGFAPVVQNYFNSSGSQIGEQLMGLISQAQRNF